MNLNRILPPEELKEIYQTAAVELNNLVLSDDQQKQDKIEFITRFKDCISLSEAMPLNINGFELEDLYIECTRCNTETSSINAVAVITELGYGKHLSIISQCPNCFHHIQERFILKKDEDGVNIQR